MSSGAERLTLQALPAARAALLSKNRKKCPFLQQSPTEPRRVEQGCGHVFFCRDLKKRRGTEFRPCSNGEIELFRASKLQLASLLLNDRPADSKRQCCERLQS